MDHSFPRGTVEDGRRTRGVCGAPQGAVISPILANVYLHYVFDLWVHRWRLTKASGDMIVIRYADDTIVGFAHEHEARTFLDERHGTNYPSSALIWLVS